MYNFEGNWDRLIQCPECGEEDMDSDEYLHNDVLEFDVPQIIKCRTCKKQIIVCMSLTFGVKEVTK